MNRAMICTKMMKFHPRQWISLHARERTSKIYTTVPFRLKYERQIYFHPETSCKYGKQYHDQDDIDVERGRCWVYCPVKRPTSCRKRSRSWVMGITTGIKRATPKTMIRYTVMETFGKVLLIYSKEMDLRKLITAGTITADCVVKPFGARATSPKKAPYCVSLYRTHHIVLLINSWEYITYVSIYTK